MTPEQCRMARALLGWAQERLHRRSGVSKTTIAKFETGYNITGPNRSAIAWALTQGGAFIGDPAVHAVSKTILPVTERGDDHAR